MRIFLEHHKNKVATDRTLVVELEQMPGTSLTEREYAELKRLQKEQFGDLFERGLSGQQLSNEEETTLLIEGTGIYGQEGIDALYYFWKEISANAQDEIDEYLLSLIAGLKKAEIKGMPTTTLTVHEIA